MFRFTTIREIKPFLLLGLATELIYLCFALLSPLKDRPSPVLTLDNENFFAITDFYYFLALVALLLAALVVYVYAYRYVIDHKPPLRLIFVFVFVFNLTLLFIPPLASRDIDVYIQDARVWSIYHANPYLVSYDTFRGTTGFTDFKTPLSGQPTIYGPLFTFLSGGLAYLGGDNYPLTLFIFKAFFALLNIACFYLIFRIAASPTAALLYGWNPLILFEFALNGHNDVVMIALLLFSFYFFIKSRSRHRLLLGWLMLLLSVFIKYISIVLVPIAFLFIFLSLKNNRARIGFAAGAVALALAVPLLLYAPFWEGGATLSSFIAQLKLENRVFSSFGIFFLADFFYHFGISHFYSWAKFLAQGIFALFYAGLIAVLIKNRTRLKTDRMVLCCLLVLLGYLALAVARLMPWYLTGLIALAAIAAGLYRKTGYILLIHWVTLYGILFYIILR